MLATAELYDRLSHVHTLSEPPSLRGGPAGMRERWEELPCAAADARRGMGGALQLLALRGCQRAMLTAAHAAHAADDGGGGGGGTGTDDVLSSDDGARLERWSTAMACPVSMSCNVSARLIGGWSKRLLN